MFVRKNIFGFFCLEKMIEVFLFYFLYKLMIYVFYKLVMLNFFFLILIYIVYYFISLYYKLFDYFCNLKK